MHHAASFFQPAMHQKYHPTPALTCLPRWGTSELDEQLSHSSQHIPFHRRAAGGTYLENDVCGEQPLSFCGLAITIKHPPSSGKDRSAKTSAC